MNNSIPDLTSLHPTRSSDSTFTHLEQFSDLNTLISHELRTPLTSICGVLGLLNSGQLGSLSDEGKRLLAIAINNTNRLVRLANAIDHDAGSGFQILSQTDLEQLQLENDLHRAFEGQEFRLAYQPIVSTETGEIISIEALARWQHPLLDMVAPHIFIPLAEKTGLIHQLGIHLLDQACRQFKIWKTQCAAALPLSISVNLSPTQLLQPGLVEAIATVLRDNNVEPSSLRLEITESALIENYAVAIAILAELKIMGVQLYIDDFGIGHSSLGRLKDFPIDALKVDRSFVQHQHWDIIAAIITLATNLGLDVIAEGVETPEELIALRNLGCKYVQGYIFSKPVDSHTATILLSSPTSTALN